MAKFAFNPLTGQFDLVGASGGGGGGGGPRAVGSHRYWKLSNMVAYGYDEDAVSLWSMTFLEGATPRTPVSSYCTLPFGDYTLGGTYPSSKLFDGDNGSLWAGLNGCSITVDLGAAYAIDHLALRTRNGVYVNETPTVFDLSFSDDGVFYTNVGTVDVAAALGFKPPSMPDANTDYTFALPTTY